MSGPVLPIEAVPTARGRLVPAERLAPYTWFRVGGPADVLFLPADEEDLAQFLTALAPEIPVTVLGVGSNVIVRDAGVAGVVVRLAGRAFGAVTVDAAAGRIEAGAGALDSTLARLAADAGLGGLEFYAGIPGAVGGALIMNAGCYGRETREVLAEAWGVDRAGRRVHRTCADFGYGYRHSRAPEGVIWTRAAFRGVSDAPEAIRRRVAEITARRETTQPIREKTGGSTFKNPPGDSAWRCVDAAGWRGRLYGGAMMSPLHANFMINTGTATASDLEGLGEAVRADVKARFGVDLEWEIKRLGRASPSPRE
jgi:UDP-N-acetylmuramate dehydrogenase